MKWGAWLWCLGAALWIVLCACFQKIDRDMVSNEVSPKCEDACVRLLIWTEVPL